MSARLPAGTVAPSRRGTRWLWMVGILSALSAAQARPSEGTELGLPGPTRSGAALHARLRDASAPARRWSSDDCVQCHEEIAKEWQGSLHRKAWQDTVFQSAYAVEPLAFCRGCHAASSDPARAPTADAASSGVDCITCHVQEGTIVGPGARTASAAHPVLSDGRLMTAAACGGCHQFNFPKASRQVVPQAMQNTAREHEQSRFADTPCQSCHMPVAGSAGATHHRHDFSVLGDAGMIRSAARVTAERLGADRIEVTVVADAVGHAFPTGDMFRRLEVRADARDARGETTVRMPPVILARRFADQPRRANGEDLSFQRLQTSDDRVPPPGVGAPRRATFVVPPSVSASRVHYQVVYQRMSAPMASAFHVDRALDEIVLAEGDVALAPSLSPKKEHP